MQIQTRMYGTPLDQGEGQLQELRPGPFPKPKTTQQEFYLEGLKQLTITINSARKSWYLAADTRFQDGVTPGFVADLAHYALVALNQTFRRDQSPPNSTNLHTYTNITRVYRGIHLEDLHQPTRIGTDERSITNVS